MRKRTLGTGGLQVSAIGYGCMGLAGVYGAAADRIDMYDRAQFVTPAVGKLTDFFGRHLADARGSK